MGLRLLRRGISRLRSVVAVHGVPTVALAVGLAVTACSSASGQRPDTLMPQVRAAASAATSVHMAGSVPQGKQTATFDVRFSGDSVAGTFGVNGHGFDVLVVNGTTYVKVDAAFLSAANAPASVCAKVCGKYVELAAEVASQLTGLLSMQTLMSEVFSTKNISSVAGRGCVFSPATLHGKPVLQCRQGPYTLDVAAHGKPYIAYFSGPHGEYIAFSAWNAVRPPTTPPASQVVSVNSLG